MRNYIQPGDTLTVTAPYDVASGDGVLVGKLFGFAAAAALSGEQVEMRRKGVFSHAKASAQTFTQGAALYWDNTNKVLTTVASGNTLVGAAAEVAANPSDIGIVVLNG